MSVTLTKIAELAKVSRVTVSRALNDRPGVSGQTREKIIALANQYNYVPNRAPVDLRNSIRNYKQKTYTFGFFYSQQRSVKQSVEPIFNGVLESAGRYLHERNHRFLLQPLPENGARDTLETWLQATPPHGCLLFDCGREERCFLDMFSDKKIPVVLITPQIHVPQAISITVDNFSGGRLAMTHLIETGRRPIAFIGGRRHDLDTIERAQAYQLALLESNLPLRKDYLRLGDDWCFQTGFDAMNALGRLSKPPAAIFAADDTIAIGAITYCLQHGINVPGDVAMIGFDNMFSERQFTPSLSSVQYDYQSLGTIAVRELLQALQEGYTPKRIEISTQIVLRNSSG